MIQVVKTYGAASEFRPLPAATGLSIRVRKAFSTRRSLQAYLAN